MIPRTHSRKLKRSSHAVSRISDRYERLTRRLGMVGEVRADLVACETDRLIEQLSGILRKAEGRLLEDPYAQAEFLAGQAYKDFEKNQELVVTLGRRTEHYPGLILQRMVRTVVSYYSVCATTNEDALVEDSRAMRSNP